MVWIIRISELKNRSLIQNCQITFVGNVIWQIEVDTNKGYLLFSPLVINISYCVFSNAAQFMLN